MLLFTLKKTKSETERKKTRRYLEVSWKFLQLRVVVKTQPVRQQMALTVFLSCIIHVFSHLHRIGQMISLTFNDRWPFFSSWNAVVNSNVLGNWQTETAENSQSYRIIFHCYIYFRISAFSQKIRNSIQEMYGNISFFFIMILLGRLPSLIRSLH